MSILQRRYVIDNKGKGHRSSFTKEQEASEN